MDVDTASKGSSGRLLCLAFRDRLPSIPANSTTTPATPHSRYYGRSLFLYSRAEAPLYCAIVWLCVSDPFPRFYTTLLSRTSVGGD
jgi:hypothetical protein